MANDKAGKILIVFLGQMFNLLLLFLLTPYLARSLSKHDYGTFAQVQILSTLFVAIFSFGLSKIFYLTVEKKEFHPNHAFKTITFAALVLGVAGSILLFLLGDFLATIFQNTDLKTPLHIYSPFLLINSLNLILELQLIHSGLVKKDMAILILTNTVKLGLLFIAIQVLGSFSFIFWIIGLIAPLLQFVCYVVSIPLSDFNGKVSKNILIFVTKTGIPLGITNVLAASYTYLAGFFVSYLFSPSQFAIFRNGAIEIPFLGIISTSVASILTPQYAKFLAEGQKDEVVKLKSLSISEIAAITYPIIILTLFFARDFLTLYLSDKYADSVTIFWIYTLILFIRVNSYEDVLAGLGKTKDIMLANVIYFLLSFVLIFSFIKFFGIFGAAVASVISIYFLAYFLLKRTAKYLEIDLGRLVNIQKIGYIILYSTILSAAVKATSIFLKIPVLQFLIVLAYFPIVYFILIRKKIITLGIYENILNKIPFGKVVFKYLN